MLQVQEKGSETSFFALHLFKKRVKTWIFDILSKWNEFEIKNLS